MPDKIQAIVRIPASASGSKYSIHAKSLTTRLVTPLRLIHILITCTEAKAQEIAGGEGETVSEVETLRRGEDGKTAIAIARRPAGYTELEDYPDFDEPRYEKEKGTGPRPTTEIGRDRSRSRDVESRPKKDKLKKEEEQEDVFEYRSELQEYWRGFRDG